MTDSSQAQTQRIHAAPRTDVSQDQETFRIHFNFPGRAVPGHGDWEGNELVTDAEHLLVIDPDAPVTRQGTIGR